MPLASRVFFTPLQSRLLAQEHRLAERMDRKPIMINTLFIQLIYGLRKMVNRNGLKTGLAIITEHYAIYYFLVELQAFLGRITRFTNPFSCQIFIVYIIPGPF